MSPLSKAKHSRNQWKHKARRRADDNRYLRKQLARVTQERARAQQALKDTQACLRQVEAQKPVRLGLLGAPIVLGSPARISRRQSCPEFVGGTPGYPQSAVPANDY
jgi:hypothetical protein